MHDMLQTARNAMHEIAQVQAIRKSEILIPQVIANLVADVLALKS